MSIEDDTLADALRRLRLVDTPVLDRLRSGSVPLADALVREQVLSADQVDVVRRVATLGAQKVGGDFGKFRIIGELGRGGMGIVYRAQDTTLGREVALKVLTVLGVADPDAIARFQREAQLAARLRHPGIVAVYEAGVEQGHPYIAMELVRGVDLHDVFAKPGRLRDRIDIVRRVAEAIHAAHADGVVHRDLKPQNILVDEQGQPRVADFGVARDIHGLSALTASGTALGTPSYMAPEQARGEPPDRRTDVYALGAILYEAVARRRAFDDTSLPRLLRRVVEQDPEPPSMFAADADRRIEAVCLKAMAKRPDARYPTAKALADDLARWLAGQPVSANRSGLIQRFASAARRRPAASGLSAAALVLGAAALVYFTRPTAFSYTVSPAAAVIEIDGRPAPAPPVALAPGSHRIRISLDGHRTIDEALTIARGASLVRRFELVPLSASLAVRPAADRARVHITGPGTDVETDAPWEAASLKPGRYVVAVWSGQSVRVAQTVDLADGDKRTVAPELPTAVAWKFDAGKMDYSALLAELDGDGVPDIVVASDRPAIIAVSGATGKQIWRRDLPDKPAGAPAAIDDGVAVGTRSGDVVIARSRDGAVLLSGRFVGDPMPQQAPGGYLLLAERQGHLRVIDRTGIVMWALLARATVPPIAAEGHVVVAPRSAILVVDARTGREIASVDVSEGPASELLAADATGDGRVEILFGCRDGSIVCVDPRERRVAWRFSTGQTSRCRPAAADLDGDGAAEVVGGSDDGFVYALDGRTGALKWKYKTGAEVHGRIAFGDLDGDGRPEVVAGSDDHRVYALDGRTGRALWWFQTGDDVDPGPLLADLDGDKRPEIVCCSNDGFIYALRMVAPR